jgi:hypothetical protein
VIAYTVYEVELERKADKGSHYYYFLYTNYLGILLKSHQRIGGK